MTRKVLYWTAYWLANIFIAIAIILGTIPALIGFACVYVAEELEGEWRRARQQTWLSRWARKQKEKYG